jgi:hypothetical protein
MRRVVLLVIALLLLVGQDAAARSSARPADWIGTWASVPTAAPATATPTLSDQTVRQVVHISVGGDQVRLRLTNEFGDQALRIGEVHVARAAGPGSDTGSDTGTGTDIVAATDRTVTFGGRRAVTVPAGAPLVSDAVALAVPAGSDLVVSIYVPTPTPVTSLHGFSYQDNVIAAGNVTRGAVGRRDEHDRAVVLPVRGERADDR